MTHTDTLPSLGTFVPTVSAKRTLSTSNATTRDSVVRFVTGRDEILRLAPKLMEFAELCGQAGAMHDLAYFLLKPGLMPRIPHLLLIGGAHLNVRWPDPADLAGAVLIFEQGVSGIGSGVFASNDRSGRSTVLSLAADRAQVVSAATRALLDRGAHMILMSFRVDEDLTWPPSPDETPLLAEKLKGRSVARWGRRDRTVPAYLELAETYDKTLATVGQKTRRNLRYYRRRAESELGCVFLPKVEISREEMLAFNKEIMFPATPEVAQWRYDMLKELAEPVLLGLKDKDGRWLSILGGRRYLGRTEILWQMNRDGLADYSIGTVMRSYVLENEIALGSRRLYTEGGTPHSIKFSFVEEDLTDLVVVRRSLLAKIMQIFARKFMPGNNDLWGMLAAEDVQWMSC